MGKRREPRQTNRLPVRVFGTNAAGQVFSENVFTVDISREGVRLSGVRSQLKVGEIVGISYGGNKARFTVQWVGDPGSSKAGEMGLASIPRDKTIWDIALPAARADTFASQSFGRQVSGAERRFHARMKCMNSVQLQPDGQAPIWGKATDLSSGGCFVEMPIPLQKGTKLKITLWINEKKLWVAGKVATSRPGYGIGIQFTQISDQDAEQLREYLKSITTLRT